jgi:hypothetical protein
MLCAYLPELWSAFAKLALAPNSSVLAVPFATGDDEKIKQLGDLIHGAADDGTTTRRRGEQQQPSPGNGLSPTLGQ